MNGFSKFLLASAVGVMLSLPAPAQDIPAEARRHMIRGEAALEDAKKNKTPADLKDAVKEFKKAAQLAPNWADAWFNLGVVQEKVEDFSGAMISYKKYLKLRPDADDKEEVGAKIIKLEYRFEKAQKAIAYFSKGNASTFVGKYARAISDYTRAIQLNPRYARAYFFRGNAYSGQGRYDLAISDFTKAIQLYPRDPKTNKTLLPGDISQRRINRDAYFNRGNAYSKQGKYARAISDYTRAIQLDPRFANAYYSRGSSYYYHMKPALAISDFTKAIQLNPRDPNAYLNRGHTYCKLGKKVLARADQKKVIELGGRVVSKCQ